MYLVVTARQGISSKQLATEVGVTQKTAWSVLGRLREACDDKLDKLRDTVETYMGGKEAHKHADKKLGNYILAKHIARDWVATFPHQVQAMQAQAFF